MHPPTNDNTPALDQASLFAGGGIMGELMRNYNWATHPLGPPGLWPKSLQTGIRMMLLSGFPMFIWWSKELYMFHNDAYIPTFVGKHEQALGGKARHIWADVWGQLGAIVEDILSHNTTFYAQDMLVVPERKGFKEETYWTFSYSPMPDDEGKVNGIFCACSDVTAKVLSERRLQTLQQLAQGSVWWQTEEQLCQSLLQILKQKTADVPLAAIYLINQGGKVAQFKGATGNYLQLPQTISLPYLPGKAHWPLEGAQASVDLELLHYIGGQLSQAGLAVMGFISPNEPVVPVGSSLPKLLILPLRNAGKISMLGFILLQISDMLEYDEAYRNFHQLLSSQLSSAIEALAAKRIQQQQADALQRQLMSLFEQMPVAVTFLKGEQFVVELANPAVLHIWGRSKASVINQPLFEAMPDIRNQGLERLLKGVFFSGIAHTGVELPIELNKEGKKQIVYFTFVYHPLKDLQGRVTGIMVVASDVTPQVLARQKIEEGAGLLQVLNEELEQKVTFRTSQLQRANTELQLANEQLSRTNQELDTFVYTASHDLKAPIVNMEGLLHVVERQLRIELQENKTLAELYKLLYASVSRLKTTIGELTEVARINREHPEDITTITIEEVFTDVCQDLQLQIREASAKLEVELDCKQLKFSRKNLKSIIHNLLSNAIKYRSLERPLIVSISCQIKEEYGVLSIKDNGLGIDTRQEEKIFGLFKRLHTHVEGTGIGLYIVKRIVENEGGRIEVESQVGQGSTFRVYFRR